MRNIVKKLYQLIEKIIPIKFLILIVFTTQYILYTFKIYFLSKKVGVSSLKNYSSNLRTSDTVFILGSGYSINDLTSEQWDKIKAHDNIGFNFWLIHDFVPKLYVYEESEEQERNDIFYSILQDKVDKYRNTVFIIKDIETKSVKLTGVPGMIKKNFYISTSLHTLNKKMSMIKHLPLVLNYVKKVLKFINKKKFHCVFNRRASLCYLVMMSYQLGYKKIVLCGVDLIDNRYFFDHVNYTGCSKPDNGASNQPHPTNQVKLEDGSISISELLFHINQEVLIPEDVKLYVTNINSKLYELFELYEWE